MTQQLIAVAEAKNLIDQHTTVRESKLVSLLNAAGYVLAEDISSPLSLPPFDQSSMDGYAFRFSDWSGSPLQISGEQPAGLASSEILETGTARRIFTGAALPPGADTVVIQEKVGTDQGKLFIQDNELSKGKNVRLTGTEIEEGVIAIGNGSVLIPAAIGLLASMGITNVKICPPPIVSLIITGNELVPPGSPLRHGQVYESNSFALRTALQQAGINEIKIAMVPDEPETLETAIELALNQSDVILITGGVSVGDYDFVVRAANNAGVSAVFHNVRQRPGKPLFFGIKGQKLLFGLPGNPGSVLTCFYQYVFPAIRKMTGRSFHQSMSKAILQKDYSKPRDLTCFVKGILDGMAVTPLGAQESYRMRSFAVANALIQLDAGKSDFLAGEQVEIHLLPV
jgi:molybdopterin molybdotransferase